MMDYREPKDNEGNDGYIWGKGLAMLASLSLTLLVLFMNGGFIGFGK